MRISALGLGLAGALYLGVSTADPSGDIPLLAGDQYRVTTAEVASRIAELAAELDLKGPPPGDSVRKIAREILKSKAMAADAEARHLPADPEVQSRLEAARRQVLRDALVKSIKSQIQVPDLAGAARDYYDGHRDQFRSPSRARLSHILFKDDPAAPAEGASGLRQRAESGYSDIRRRLEAGESFAALAREYSQDKGTAARGGALGDWTTGENLDQRFAAAAFALEPGQVSALVETRFGFHIIRMDERTPATTLPYEQVRAEILKNLRDDYLARQLAEALQSYDDLANAAQWDEAAVMSLSQGGEPPPAADGASPPAAGAGNP